MTARLNGKDGDIQILDSSDTVKVIFKSGSRLSGVDIYDGTDIAISATTGTKIGQSGSKLGFFGTTPAVRQTAYTQTYSTATRTHSNLTSAAVATTASSTAAAAAGYGTKAQADAVVTAINALRVDVTNIKGVLNQVIDDLQTHGLFQ